MRRTQQRQGLVPGNSEHTYLDLKCFLRFLHEDGYLQTGLAARDKLRKVDVDTIGAFDEKQVLLLLAAPSEREYVGSVTICCSPCFSTQD